MENIMKFPCKECIVKIVCHEQCVILDEMKRNTIENNLKRNICPDCGSDIIEQKLRSFIYMHNSDRQIGHFKCSNCNHTFKYMFDKKLRFLERMFT